MKRHFTPGLMLLCIAMLAACGGSNPEADASTTTSLATTTSTTTTGATVSSSSTSSTTSTTSTTTTTLAPPPSMVVTDAMKEFPAYQADGFTFYYAEDPDPQNLGCEGFPQTRLWVQRGDGPAELITELPEAGTVYPGPENRVLIVTGCEGFLGSLYHADLSADGHISNVEETYLALEAAFDFEWLDRDTITLTAATYEGAWGGQEDETRPLTISLDAAEHVVVTTRGEAPVVAAITECTFNNGTLTVVADDELFGPVTIAEDTVSYLDRSVTATEVYAPDPDFPLFSLFGSTAEGKGVVTSVWAPGCLS